MPAALTLAVVGADHPNKRGPGRRFEIAMCKPGELVRLQPEPNNPADPHAIMVLSARNIQIGYVRANRVLYIERIMARGAEIQAIFQETAPWGANIRVAFDGDVPTLPPARPTPNHPEADWWPDEKWPEE